MNLKIIMISERSKTKNSTSHITPFVFNFRKCKLKAGEQLSQPVVRQQGINGCRITKGMKKLLRVMDMFIFLIVIMVS